jgi:hypothetical protein
MTTMVTDTVRITIDAAFDQVVSDLADPANHPEWGAEFFTGPARPGPEGEVVATVPRMGGEVHMKVEADLTSGRIDLYMAPLDVPFGPPLPVRVVPNGEGVDVLFTLARFPGQSDAEWQQGLESMGRELENLKTRHES